MVGWRVEWRRQSPKGSFVPAHRKAAENDDDGGLGDEVNGYPRLAPLAKKISSWGLIDEFG
jgi:hypothetical protein